MPYISIIVPVYNVEKWLERCILSLVSQSYDNIEIILVDDGSTDNSGSICDKYAALDARIRVIHKQNSGLSGAKNAGLDAAEGDFITFVDSDDFVTTDYVKYLLSLFDICPESNVCACAHFIVKDGACRVSTDYADKCVLPRKEVYKYLLYHDRVDVCSWAKLYRRQVFDSLRFPVGKLYEDTYLFCDVMSKSRFMVFGGRAQYFYIKRVGSIVSGGFNKSRLDYLDATEHLVNGITYPDLHRGCVRRLSHARLSVLRYMENCKREYLPYRKRLKRQILDTAPCVLFDKNTPKRDKAAICLLFFGTAVFFRGWRTYERLRRV